MSGITTAFNTPNKDMTKGKAKAQTDPKAWRKSTGFASAKHKKQKNLGRAK